MNDDSPIIETKEFVVPCDRCGAPVPVTVRQLAPFGPRVTRRDDVIRELNSALLDAEVLRGKLRIVESERDVARVERDVACAELAEQTASREAAENAYALAINEWGVCNRVSADTSCRLTAKLEAAFAERDALQALVDAFKKPEPAE